LDILLEAMAIVSKTIGNLTLIIAGAVQSERLAERYNKMISELPKEIRVIYHSDFIPREKVAVYFLASDALILPYKIISHSGVLHLAYSFGRAIIGTRVGDFEEFIEDGKSGFLAKSNDSVGIAEAIIRFYSNPYSVKKMCSYARNLNDTKFSWTNIGLSMKEIYKQLKI
jgi:glycosyltransferase involved in cell wall biosynthesis